MPRLSPPSAPASSSGSGSTLPPPRRGRFRSCAYGLGGVVLLGGYHDGMASVQAVTAHLHALAGPDIGLMVSADQGGCVQQLRAPVLDDAGTAYYQGTSWSHSTLLAQTTRWGAEIPPGGVDIDLAPVADTVAASFMSQNGPIGHYNQLRHDVRPGRRRRRHRGRRTPRRQGRDDGQALPGLGGSPTTPTRAAPASPTPGDLGSLSHPFQVGSPPGAGRRRGGVVPHDPARQGGVSPKVIGGPCATPWRMPVVASDDIGTAVAVQSTPVADRATEFLDAGGDVLLTAAPATVAPMIGAILAESSSSTSFADKVEASVLRVHPQDRTRTHRVLRAGHSDERARPLCDIGGHLGEQLHLRCRHRVSRASGEVYTDAPSGARPPPGPADRSCSPRPTPCPGSSSTNCAGSGRIA